MIKRSPMAACKMWPIWRRTGEFPCATVASKWVWSLEAIHFVIARIRPISNVNFAETREN